MLWNPGDRSKNLEDRRDEVASSGSPFGGGGVRLGLGGTLVVLTLSLIFKKDLFSMLAGGDSDDSPAVQAPTAPRVHSADEEKLVDFVSFVLDDVQGTWHQIFTTQGQTYHDAKLVLFTNAVRSGCGFAESAMGPFYCPTDHKVYIDLGFYRDLRTRFGAPGDFAQAYVIAHEMGHHVQSLLGTSDRMRALQEAHPDQGNALSVRLELQADCLAGVWGHATQQRAILQAGDVEEAMGAAAAVGDDRLQQQAGARVNPERWTHGSSAQRVAWFKRGMTSGQLSACDTFASSAP